MGYSDIVGTQDNLSWFPVKGKDTKQIPHIPTLLYIRDKEYKLYIRITHCYKTHYTFKDLTTI